MLDQTCINSERPNGIWDISMIRTNSLRLPGISGVKLVEMLLVLVVLATCITPAHGADGDVLRATLKNGLRVIIVRNTLAPVVATSVN